MVGIMVWDNWNPVKDLSDEWGATASIWGKLKVILFYSYVWIAFVGCAYSAFVPWFAGMDCILTNSTKQQDELAFVIRQSNIYAAAWLLFVAKGKTHLPNMRVLVAVLILSCMFGTFYEPSVMTTECNNTWMAQWWWWIGWPALAMIFAYVERHVDGTTTTGTAGETQALV